MAPITGLIVTVAAFAVVGLLATVAVLQPFTPMLTCRRALQTWFSARRAMAGFDREWARQNQTTNSGGI